MDKDTVRNVMRAPYIDLGRGQKRRTIVSYSNLTSSLKTRISAADLTEHELLGRIIIQQKINNLHRMSLSDLAIDEDDIEWP